MGTAGCLSGACGPLKTSALSWSLAGCTYVNGRGKGWEVLDENPRP